MLIFLNERSMINQSPVIFAEHPLNRSLWDLQQRGAQKWWPQINETEKKTEQQSMDNLCFMMCYGQLVLDNYTQT